MFESVPNTNENNENNEDNEKIPESIIDSIKDLKFAYHTKYFSFVMLNGDAVSEKAFWDMPEDRDPNDPAETVASVYETASKKEDDAKTTMEKMSLRLWMIFGGSHEANKMPMDVADDWYREFREEIQNEAEIYNQLYDIYKARCEKADSEYIRSMDEFMVELDEEKIFSGDADQLENAIDELVEKPQEYIFEGRSRWSEGKVKRHNQAAEFFAKRFPEVTEGLRSELEAPPRGLLKRLEDYIKRERGLTSAEFDYVTIVNMFDENMQAVIQEEAEAYSQVYDKYLELFNASGVEGEPISINDFIEKVDESKLFSGERVQIEQAIADMLPTNSAEAA